MVQTVWTIVILQLQFLDKVIDAPVQGVLVVDIPVMVPRPVPIVFPVWKTRESPLQYFSWWLMPLLCRFAGSR